jgi:hypothetical protein
MGPTCAAYRPGFSAQVWELSTQFLPKDWILEQWDDGYYITALAGSTTVGLGCTS